MTLRRTVLAFFSASTCTALSANAWAQGSGDPGRCHSVSDKFERLACYDEVTQFPASSASASPSVAAGTAEAPSPAEADRLGEDFIARVSNLDFQGAAALLPSNVLDIPSDSLSSMEEAVLEVVRPLPGSQIESNLAGYQLLLSLRPDNALYGEKVAQYEAALLAQKSEALQRLDTERDDFRNITFYSHEDEPRYIDERSRISLYIAVPDSGRPLLRVKTIYTEDSWLFVDSMTVSIDGQVSSFTSGEFQRDNDSEIWEWRDEVPSSYQLDLLRQIGSATEVVMRFDGQQYYDDKNLSASDRQMIRDVLVAYDQMIETQ